MAARELKIVGNFNVFDEKIIGRQKKTRQFNWKFLFTSCTTTLYKSSIEFKSFLSHFIFNKTDARELRYERTIDDESGKKEKARKRKKFLRARATEWERWKSFEGMDNDDFEVSLNRSPKRRLQLEEMGKRRKSELSLELDCRFHDRYHHQYHRNGLKLIAHNHRQTLEPSLELRLNREKVQTPSKVDDSGETCASESRWNRCHKCKYFLFSFHYAEELWSKIETQWIQLMCDVSLIRYFFEFNPWARAASLISADEFEDWVNEYGKLEIFHYPYMQTRSNELEHWVWPCHDSRRVRWNCM